ncbi:hypothetical protein [Gluconobacter cerinus]|uniref:hypothetical protein n=1 Tax=Gluconobacter cerinus TaxID=38307 RepID=UPI003AB8C954
MTKAHVLNKTLSSEDRRAIQDILEARRFEVVFGMPADFLVLSGSDAIGVICLPAAEADSELLAERARDFAGVGLRVIGIWLHDETEDLPTALGDFGSAVVTMGSTELDRVLHESAAAVWERPGGARRADQPTPRNKC